jgi:hypothetical protein
MGQARTDTDFSPASPLMDVRFGSLADIGVCLGDVRFAPNSRHVQ